MSLAECNGPDACPHVAAARADTDTVRMLIESQQRDRAAQTKALEHGLDRLGDRLETRLAAQTSAIDGRLASQERGQWWLMVLVILGLLGLAGSKAADELLTRLPFGSQTAHAGQEHP